MEEKLFLSCLLQIIRLIKMYKKFYYENENFKLINNDTFKALQKFEDKIFDMIFDERIK